MLQKDFPAGSPFWRSVALALRLMKGCADFRLVALAIALHASPLSPYVRMPGEECRYVGARGAWTPGWTASCPRWALRRHFNF